MDKGKCFNVKVIRNSVGLVIGKYCGRCWEYFDVEDFDWNLDKKGYLLSWCKDCNLDI